MIEKHKLSALPHFNSDHTTQAMDHEPTYKPNKPSQFKEQLCEAMASNAMPIGDYTISPEGMQHLFEELGLTVQDKETMALAWKMDLANMGKHPTRVHA